MLKLSLAKIFKANRPIEKDVENQFWLISHIDKWLPPLLGIILGVVVARLIVDESWHLAIPVVFLIPTVVIFNRYPFVAVLIWLALAPFIQITPTDPIRIIYWMIHRAIIPVALIIVLLSDQLRIKRISASITLGRADLAIAISAGILLLSVFLNYKNPLPVLYEVYDRFLIPFCVYWLIYFLTPNEQDLKRLLPIAFLMIIIQVTVGLLSWYAPDTLPDFWVKTSGRTEGTFKGYTGYTIGLVTYTLLLFHAAVNRKLGLIRTMFLVVFGIGVLGIFLSFSRGSWLAISIVTIGLLFIYPKVSSKMIIILLVLTVILGNGIMADKLAYAEERLNTDRTALDRLVIYNTSWNMIKVKPFWGWGYDTYDLYDTQFETRVANHITNYNHTSHNTFLTIIVERGVIGFLIYYFPVFWWLYLTFRVWPTLPKEGFWSRKLLVIFWLIILFQVVVGNFSDTKRDTFAYTTWWMSLGFIASMVTMYLDPTQNTTFETSHRSPII